VAEFKTQTYRNAAGQERIVTSVDGAVAAEFDGYYSPDSPTGKRLAARRAAETRKANTEKKTATNGRRTRKATAKTPTREPVDASAGSAPTPEAGMTSAERAAAAGTPTS